MAFYLDLVKRRASRGGYVQMSFVLLFCLCTQVSADHENQTLINTVVSTSFQAGSYPVGNITGFLGTWLQVRSLLDCGGVCDFRYFSFFYNSSTLQCVLVESTGQDTDWIETTQFSTWVHFIKDYSNPALAPVCDYMWVDSVGKCVEIVTMMVTFDTARDDCLSRGGDLICLASELQFNDFRLFLIDYGETGSFHIGFRYIYDYGDWTWLCYNMTQTVTTGYTQFATPLDTGSVDRCAAMDSYADYFVQSELCSAGSAFGYICQY